MTQLTFPDKLKTLIVTLRVNDWTAFAILAMFVYLSLILVLKVLEKNIVLGYSAGLWVVICRFSYL